MLFFFFFQAEDGIRDKLVTGVQTCALPIFRDPATPPSGAARRRRLPRAVASSPGPEVVPAPSAVASVRQSARRRRRPWPVHSQRVGRHRWTARLVPQRLPGGRSAASRTVFGQLFRRARGPDARVLPIQATSALPRLRLLLLHQLQRRLRRAVG